MKRIVLTLVFVGGVALGLVGVLVVLQMENPGRRGMTNPSDIPVATILYQWFGYEHDRENGWPSKEGPGTFHWNDIVFDELITGFVVNRPEIGYYSSDDPSVVAWQLEQMKRAGINTIIVSWWGWGDMDLDGHVDEQTEGYIEQRSHDALRELLNQIESKSLEFKVAIMVEPWPDTAMPTPAYQRPPNAAFNLTADQKKVIFDYLWDNVYEVWPDQMFMWQGKPLLIAVPKLFFGPDDDPRFTLRSFRFKQEDYDPGNAWDWIITDPLPYIQNVEVGGEEETIAILSPRYDEWFLAAANPSWWPEAWCREETGPIRHDPYLTEDLYDLEWRQVYEERENIDLIILWAWNSWMEQLYIEPDSGDGAAPAGDLLVRKTAFYARGLMSGSDFEMFQPDLVTVRDFRSVLSPISPQQLNLRSDAGVDQLLLRIIRQAQSHVETYLGREFNPSEPAPDAVKEVVFRLSASIYNYLLATKSGNLVRVGEFGVTDLSDTVFTDGMRRDLSPFRKKRTGIKVLSP